MGGVTRHKSVYIPHFGNPWGKKNSTDTILYKLPLNMKKKTHHVITSYRAGLFFRKTGSPFHQDALYSYFDRNNHFMKRQYQPETWSRYRIPHFLLNSKIQEFLCFFGCFSGNLLKNPSWINKKINENPCSHHLESSDLSPIIFTNSEQLKGGNILNQKQQPAGSGFTSLTSGSCHAPCGPWPVSGQKLTATSGWNMHPTFSTEMKYTYMNHIPWAPAPGSQWIPWKFMHFRHQQKIVIIIFPTFVAIGFSRHSPCEVGCKSPIFSTIQRFGHGVWWIWWGILVGFFVWLAIPP